MYRIKKYILATMSLMLIFYTACGNAEVTNKESKKETETSTEQSTRIPNSVVGIWYECDDGVWVNVWEFETDGEYYYDNEEWFGKEDETYHVSRDKYTVYENTIILDGIEATIEYTDYGIHIKGVDSPYDVELYEYRQAALESTDRYWTSDKYYETLKDENGYVIEDGVLIRYFANEKEIVIPDNVTELGCDVIVSDIEKVTKLTIPGNVKRIGENAFWQRSLGVVIIEDGVEEIGDSAFRDTYYDEIHIPTSVKKIGAATFSCGEGNEEGKIYVKKGSYAENYFKENSDGKSFFGAEIIVEE